MPGHFLDYARNTHIAGCACRFCDHLQGHKESIERQWRADQAVGHMMLGFFPNLHGLDLSLEFPVYVLRCIG